MKKDYLIVGDILKERRLEKGLTLRDVDRFTDVSRAEISKIERGERENINMRYLIKLCKFYEIDFVKLLEVAGYFDEEVLKVYEVNATKTSEKIYKIKAENEKQALEIISKFVFDNDILELKNDDKIEFTAEEINEEFDEEYDEDDDEDDEECGEVYDCENCPHYCHICGECTLGE